MYKIIYYNRFSYNVFSYDEIRFYNLEEALLILNLLDNLNKDYKIIYYYIMYKFNNRYYLIED